MRGVSCMLKNAEDLALKAYVTARCVSRQLRMDGGKGSRIAELEERLALLEEEKTGLQGDLATARTEAEKKSGELDAALLQARAAEDAKSRAEAAQKHAEERRARGKETIKAWYEALSTGSDAVQAAVHELLEKHGLRPLPLS